MIKSHTKTSSDNQTNTKRKKIKKHKTQTNQWIVTSSDHQPMTFSSSEMTHIVASMPNDGRALFLENNDFRPLMRYMTENNIRPQTNSALPSGMFKHTGTTSHESGFYDHERIRGRMRELAGSMRSGVTIRAVRSQQKWVVKSGVARLSMNGAPRWAISYQDAQIDGKKSILESALRSAKQGTKEYAMLNTVLKQPITEQLYQIRTRPSSEGEKIVAEIQSKWPYCIPNPTSDEVPAIRKYVEQVGFNELQAAYRMLEMRKKAERYDSTVRRHRLQRFRQLIFSRTRKF